MECRVGYLEFSSAAGTGAGPVWFVASCCILFGCFLILIPASDTSTLHCGVQVQLLATSPHWLITAFCHQHQVTMQGFRKKLMPFIYTKKNNSSQIKAMIDIPSPTTRKRKAGKVKIILTRGKWATYLPCTHLRRNEAFQVSALLLPKQI